MRRVSAYICRATLLLSQLVGPACVQARSSNLRGRACGPSGKGLGRRGYWVALLYLYIYTATALTLFWLIVHWINRVVVVIHVVFLLFHHLILIVIVVSHLMLLSKCNIVTCIALWRLCCVPSLWGLWRRCVSWFLDQFLLGRCALRWLVCSECQATCSSKVSVESTFSASLH